MEMRRHHSSIRVGIILVQKIRSITHFLEFLSYLLHEFSLTRLHSLCGNVCWPSNLTNISKIGAVLAIFVRLKWLNSQMYIIFGARNNNGGLGAPGIP
jgi:hypothetical protein